MTKQEYIASKKDISVKEAVLSVSGFSCLADVKIRFNKLTVLIGEQASGKSITCKLFYFFTQAVRRVALSALYAGKTYDLFAKDLKAEFLQIFPATAWQNDTFVILWDYGRNHFKVWHKAKQKKLHIELPEIESGYDKLLALTRKGPKMIDDFMGDYTEYERRMKFEQEVESKVCNLFSATSVDYIPAGRSFFSTIQDALFTLLANNIGIDYFLKEFGQKLESYRFSFRRRLAGDGLSLHKTILHGGYFYDGKEQWIISDDKHKVRLAEASSGQQEALPLLMVLTSGAMPRFAETRMIIIEEPEAHLYPSAQKNIVDYLGRRLSGEAFLSSVITTHSPYILCCINNLLARHKSLRSSITAYHLYEGKAELIFDEELGLIEAGRFDEVSSQIANESLGM